MKFLHTPCANIVVGTHQAFVAEPDDAPVTAHAVHAGVLFAFATVGYGGAAVELLLWQHYM